MDNPVETRHFAKYDWTHTKCGKPVKRVITVTREEESNCEKCRNGTT